MRYEIKLKINCTEYEIFNIKIILSINKLAYIKHHFFWSIRKLVDKARIVVLRNTKYFLLNRDHSVLLTNLKRSMVKSVN